jgi:hypothetical protein
MFSSLYGSCKHIFFQFSRNFEADGAGTRSTNIEDRGQGMFGGSSRSDAFVLALLRFLTQVESWHVIAAGTAGTALCVIFGRTSTFGLIGATLCGVVAVAGVTHMWRSFGAPRQVAAVIARTVGAQGGDDAVDWKFEDPRTIFAHSRHPGDALWIEGIRIFAQNLSSRPLTNLRAVVRSHRAGREMKMNLILDDRQLEGSEPQTVPARSDFSLLYMIPSALSGRASGMPAAQFVPAFGDLNFTLFARLVSVPEIEQQLLRIEQEGDNAAPAPGQP